MRIPTEAVIGSVFLIIILGLGYMMFFSTPAEPPSEEICDLKDNDYDGEVDEGFTVTCEKHEDCGQTGTFGEKYCKNGDVWQGFYENTCDDAGTCLSECMGQQTEIVVQKCQNDCLSGACL